MKEKDKTAKVDAGRGADTVVEGSGTVEGVSATIPEEREREEVVIREKDPEKEKERAAVPKRIGRFDIYGVLGAGGMARVYRAFDTTLDRLVALKLLHEAPGGKARDDAAHHRRLLREARAAAALTHPNIVTIYEVGEADGVPFIAMELLEGSTLRAASATAASLSTRLRWLVEAARALAAAHEKGMVHRDIKPDNMFVDTAGRLRLLDFGIAKRREDEVVAMLNPHDESAEGPSSLRTALGRRVGTPRYMAPEQRAGEATDASTDQYAWGLVAFEVLTGKLPTESATAEQRRERLEEHGVPRAVAEVIVRALAVVKEERSPSMTAVADVVESAITTMSVPRSDAPSPATAASTQARTESHQDPSAPRAALARGKPRRMGVVLAVLALAAVVAGAAVLVVRRTNAGPPSGCTITRRTVVDGWDPTVLTLVPGGKMLVGGYTEAQGKQGKAPALGVDRVVLPEGRIERFDLPVPFELHDASLAPFLYKGHPAVVVTQPQPKSDTPFKTFIIGLDAASPRATKGTMGDLLWSARSRAAPFSAAAFEVDGEPIIAMAGHFMEASDQGAARAQVLLIRRQPGTTDKLDMVYEVAGHSIDDIKVATTADRIALAFRDARSVTVVELTRQLSFVGDAITLPGDGDHGPPAVAYHDGDLVVATAHRVGGATRLLVERRVKGAVALAPVKGLEDESVATSAPALVSIPNGALLVAWVANTPVGAKVRAARLGAKMSAPFDVGDDVGIRILTGASDDTTATLAWKRANGNGVRAAIVTCPVTKDFPK